MRLIVLLVIAALLPAFSVNAAQTTEQALLEIQKKQEAIRDTSEQTREEFRKANITPLAERLAAIEKELEPLRSDYRSNSRRVLGLNLGAKPLQAQQRGEIEGRIAVLEGERKDIETKLKPLLKQDRDEQKKHDEAERKIDDIEKNLKNREEKTKTQIAKLQEKLARAESGKALDDIESDVKDVKRRINELVSVWDHGVAGVYLREKFAQLLNDGNALCEATAQCVDGKRDSAKKKKVTVDTLFNNSSATRTRDEGGNLTSGTD